MKLPRVTSILLVVLVSLTFLNFILKYYTYFVLIVSSSKSSIDEVNSIAQETGEVPHPHELYVPLLTFIPTKSPVLTRPWVLVTNSFIEETVAGLVINFMLFFYLGKYLENMWGSREYVNFIITIVLISNSTIYLYHTIRFLLFGESSEVPPVVMSSMAINMGLFVAIKQRISNHYLLFFKGNLRIKIAYLPFILLVSLTFLSFLDEDFKISLQLSVLGFIISWVYLRFFKVGTNDRQSYLLPFALNRKRSNKNKFKVKLPPKSTLTTSSSSSNPTPEVVPPKPTPATLQLDNSSLKGDRSEQFSLYTFFPYPLSILVKLAGEIVFNTLVRYELLNKKDFITFEDEEDPYLFDDVDNLQSNLFGLSPLTGAQGDISAFPNATSKLKKVWNWISSNSLKASSNGLGLKTSMDKRRKLALRELE